MNWRNCRASLPSRPKGCHDPVMKEKASSRILYYFLTACIFVAAVLVYKAWWDRYFRLRPELAVAEPAVLSLDVPMDGVLIWEENILVSPVDGTLHFPAGRGPFYCARGDVVAELVSASGKRQVKAPAPGYFMAALDGSEGNWSYGLLWPGSSRLPVTGPLEFLEEGTNITSGRPLGKFIPQPQPLRCVSHVAKAAIGWDPSKRTHLEIRKTAADLSFRAEVRAVKDLGPTLKIYITLPFFSAEDLRSRNVSLFLHAGEAKGVMIPESAVTVTDRKKVVFLVTGDRSVAVEVSGRPVSGKRFLVEKGLDPGDLVIANATRGFEGEIRIW